MDRTITKESHQNIKLTAYETAQNLLDHERKFLTGFDVAIPFPEVTIDESMPAAEIISQLLKHNAKMDDFFSENIFANFHDPIYEPFIETMLINQKGVDSLEPIALKERSDTDKPVASIVRFDSLWGSFLACEPVPVYKDGTPHLLALANAEASSSYEQLRQIVGAAVDPLLEIQAKTNLIKCIVLGGGIVSETKVAGDIDLVLVLNQHLNYKDKSTLLNTGLSKNALKFVDTLNGIHDGFETPKIEFDIVGDTITTEHKLQITVKTTDEFLQYYGIEEPLRRAYLENTRNAMKMEKPEKARFYEKVNLTFPETFVKTGGQIIFGENITDKNGNEVFKFRDDDLLK